MAQATDRREGILDGGPGGAVEPLPRPFGPELVPRPRLVDRLLGSPPARLVLLRAPAGYGKTTTLAEWAAAEVRPFAWLQVEPSHDDPAALSNALEDALGGRDGPFVLVVDGAEALVRPEAWRVVEASLASLPAGSQLALTSRIEPPLHLGQMRANRQLLELTESDLAMTRDEARELLARLPVKLSPAEAHVVLARCDGWPAALYLAGTSVVEQAQAGERSPRFGGDDRFLADYLRQEVLSGLSRARLRFMRGSAVLEELEADACDAVLERSSSGRTLRALARTNALVFPLDHRDARFRYHPLLRELLRSELHREDPAREAELHARASRWYAEHAEPTQAIEHAIAAGEVERAGSLIWRAFPELSGHGQLESVGEWLRLLGEDRLEGSATLALIAAHYHIVRGEGNRAAHWTRMAAGFAKGGGSRAARLRADVRLLDATLAREGLARMGDDAARASELLAAESPWQTPALLYRGVASHLSGHSERALPLLRDAARRGAVVSPIIQGLALVQSALIVRGDDSEAAARLIAQAREQADRCALETYPALTMVYAASALFRARAGRVERARADFDRAIRLLGELHDFPDWYEAQARLLLAAACRRLDEREVSERLLAEASRGVERVPDAVILRDWLDEATAAQTDGSPKERADRWALTTAELRTLQYLPTHLSFREIGERIYVSPNTVKTQAQAVYRKLGVTSRTAAVKTAREAGLLDDHPNGDRA